MHAAVLCEWSQRRCRIAPGLEPLGTALSFEMPGPPSALPSGDDLERAGRVPEDGHAGEPGNHLPQQLEPLSFQVRRNPAQPCDVSAGVREALDKTRANGIADGEHYEGNRRRRLLDGEGSRRASGTEYIDRLGDQLANESGKAIILSFGPSILDQDVFPLDVAEVTQP